MRPTIRRGPPVLGVVGALALLALIANASRGAADLEGHTDGPVISLGEDWNAYPTAQVTGRIALVDDCLLLDASVVFWPHQTTWDEGRQAVEFSGDFEASAPASVGEKFTGGGGYYSAEDVRGMKSLDAEAVLRCMRETDADGVVFAYPAD